MNRPGDIRKIPALALSAEPRRAVERWLGASAVVGMTSLATAAAGMLIGASAESAGGNELVPPVLPGPALPVAVESLADPPEGPQAAALDPPPVDGLLTFRGNRTRTYYGRGPVPTEPRVVWSFPEDPMCRSSTDGGSTSTWCGTGWTGQPAVLERMGRTWLVFGAYDGAVHFVDAGTGTRILPDYMTGDIIKGSVTVDPDGFPLIYVGSRDNNFRVIAIDRDVPTELWRLAADAVTPVLWNDDWDGSALVVDDHLIEGGENGQWHLVKLNRTYRDDGLVSVSPELVFHAPGWDDQLLDDLGDTQVSIESSVAIWGDTVYFANSGGLVQGWDIRGLREGRPPSRNFRFWTGDDTDATVVIDDEGMLYVASEWERRTARAEEVGQIMKLDPRRDDPLLWSVPIQWGSVSGVWATPALYRDLVVVATHEGRLLGIDRLTGSVRWAKTLPGPTWQSPVVVDGVLLQGDCEGVLHAYDISDTRVEPPELWAVELGGCIESTPAVWKSSIYVGTRAGFFLGLGDGRAATRPSPTRSPEPSRASSSP